MEKNSDFIRNKEFHIIFKGYKPEEVDKFLDQMSFEFDRLTKRNHELAESLDKLKFEGTVEEDTDMKRIIQDALVSAHKVAEDIKSQAKKEAEELLDKRKFENEKTLEDLKLKKLQIEQSIILLQSKYDEFKLKVNKTIDELSGILRADDFKYDVVREMEIDEAQEIDTGKVNEEINQEVPETEEIPEVQTDDSITEEPGKENENQSGYYFDDNPVKKERKKIDIANPDIIEDFFKTSDD
jgi:cell division initiation protein